MKKQKQKKKKKKNRIWHWIKTHPKDSLLYTLLFTLLITIAGDLCVTKIQKHIILNTFYSRPYVTLDSDYTQVFQLSKEVPNLEYSINESDWEELKTTAIVFGGSHGKLLLRGKNKIGTNGANISFATDANVICTGDISTLIDYENYKETSTFKANFKQLFLNCSQLIITPELTPKNLADSCYYEMFSGCTSLKIAPELPADSLSKNCYSYMFYGCSSIEKAPELSAVNLADSCYYGMFENCSSLKYIPVIKAKNMNEYCFSYMFKGCTSLVTACELPAENMAEGCYSYMFSGCSSLIIAPNLPAEKLAKNCYSHMFSNCTSLFVTPPLPAKNLAEGCYSSMFYGCSSLGKAPVLPAEKLAPHCYSSIFRGCTSLDEITIATIELPLGYSLGLYIFALSKPSNHGILSINKQAKWIDDSYGIKGWDIKLIDKKEIEHEVEKQQRLHNSFLDHYNRKNNNRITNHGHAIEIKATPRIRTISNDSILQNQ